MDNHRLGIKPNFVSYYLVFVNEYKSCGDFKLFKQSRANIKNSIVSSNNDTCFDNCLCEIKVQSENKKCPMIYYVIL